jgi:asparagine synthase (glutamine-hydrolysing)
MCRIAGIYNPLSSDLETDILTMRDAMHRGGPDGKGVFIAAEHHLAFGHRRLALLDLTEAGHQPMTSTDGSLEIIFNGEIYNF